MYVRKFEGDNLSETLQVVKSELGPDAIILKTNTFKNGFKKNKVEITAAISKDDYEKKMKMDSLLNDEQKKSFYNSSSKNIKKSLTKDEKQTPTNYGSLGLNKNVQANRIENDLDVFLDEPKETRSNFTENFNDVLEPIASSELSSMNSQNHNLSADLEEKRLADLNKMNNKFKDLQELYDRQTHDLEVLMSKYSQIESSLEGLYSERSSTSKINELRKILSSFELSEKIISTIVRKAQFELSDEELENEDLLYDLTLREINEIINVKDAMFSNINFRNESVVSILISEGATGQSSMSYKLSQLSNDSFVIEYTQEEISSEIDFSKDMLGIKKVTVNSLQSLVKKVREANDEGNNVFIDLNAISSKSDETKKIIQTIKKSFSNVEIFLSLSAIHSEQYNRKVLNRYNDVTDLYLVSHLDLCVNLATLINLQFEFKKPFSFFGTGNIIPSDIQTATKEKLMEDIFNL